MCHSNRIMINIHSGCFLVRVFVWNNSICMFVTVLDPHNCCRLRVSDCNHCTQVHDLTIIVSWVELGMSFSLVEHVLSSLLVICEFGPSTIYPLLLRPEFDFNFSCLGWKDPLRTILRKKLQPLVISLLNSGCWQNKRSMPSGWKYQRCTLKQCFFWDWSFQM